MFGERVSLAQRVSIFMSRHIVFRKALPKSGCGKVTKNDVRDMLPRRGEIALPAAG